MRLTIYLGLWLALLTAGVYGRAGGPDVRTEVERLRVEAVALKAELARAVADADACRGELGPARTRLNRYVIAEEVAKLKADLAAAHPDHIVTDQLELLPKPKPKPGSPVP